MKVWSVEFNGLELAAKNPQRKSQNTSITREELKLQNNIGEIKCLTN